MRINFAKMFGLGLEAEENTQELQENIDVVVDTEDVTNIVDDLEETFEMGSNFRESTGDIDSMPEELQAEIDAIEEAADPHAQEGSEVMSMQGDDPLHEEMGGVDLANDTEETTNAYDAAAEYAKVEMIDVTGDQPDMDEEFRKDYDQVEPDEESGITAPAENEMIIDAETANAEPLSEDVRGNHGLQGSSDDVSENDADEVDAGELESAGDETPNILDGEDEEVSEDEDEEIATESEDMEDEEEVEDEESEEVESDDSDDDVAEEDVSDDEGSADEEVVETEEGGYAEDSPVAEEHEVVDSISVEIEENPVLSEEGQSEAEQEADNVEIDGHSALDTVTEMVSVNTSEGQQDEAAAYDEYKGEEEGAPIETAEIGGDTTMSDVIGDMVKEDSHGEEDAVYEGDIPADGNDVEEQVSEDGDVEVEESSEEVESEEETPEEDAAETEVDAVEDAPETDEDTAEEAEEEATEDVEEAAEEDDTEEEEEIKEEDEE